jgi:hypothetical protein
MGYKHTNSKGVTYFLNGKDVTLNSNKISKIYYFSRDERPEAIDLPEDREVAESPRTGMLVLKKKS